MCGGLPGVGKIHINVCSIYDCVVCLVCLYMTFYVIRNLIPVNPLTAGVAYIGVFIFYWHINYHLLNMLKIKYDINQQYMKTIDLHFVKSE